MAIPADIADSPAGHRLDYVLRHLRGRGHAPDEAEVEDNFFTGETPAERWKENLSLTREALGEFELRSVRSPDPNMVIAVVAHGGHISSLGIRVERQPPHRIRNVTRTEARPGYNVRRATNADAAVLREIELNAPIVLGDVRVIYDRGEDYFAAERLMGDAMTHVLEREGQAVGLLSSVINEIRVDGRDVLGLYIHRLRVLPAARGGVANMLGFASFEAYAWRADVSYGFVAAQNAPVLRNSSIAGWSIRPERIVIDTALQAGPAHGRAATPEDVDRIVSLLNYMHEREEIYVSYTRETLAARLERQPDLYSWRHLRLGTRAVVGVWPAQLSVIREAEGVTTKDDRALVLDYGCEHGGEDELISLIRAECAELTRVGTSELTIFTCPPSPLYPRLTALAKRVEPYRLQLYLAEPPDLAERGVFVDQLYF